MSGCPNMDGHERKQHTLRRHVRMCPCHSHPTPQPPGHATSQLSPTPATRRGGERCAARQPWTAATPTRWAAHLAQERARRGHKLIIHDPFRQEAVLIRGQVGAARVQLRQLPRLCHCAIPVVALHAPCNAVGKPRGERLHERVAPARRRRRREGRLAVPAGGGGAAGRAGGAVCGAAALEAEGVAVASVIGAVLLYGPYKARQGDMG